MGGLLDLQGSRRKPSPSFLRASSSSVSLKRRVHPSVQASANSPLQAIYLVPYSKTLVAFPRLFTSNSSTVSGPRRAKGEQLRLKGPLLDSQPLILVFQGSSPERVAEFFRIQAKDPIALPTILDPLERGLSSSPLIIG